MLPPLLLVVLWSCLVTSSLAQRLPENDDDRFNFDIPVDVVFYDTKILPEAKEVTVFLPRNETKRFFFVVEQNRKPVYFALTPCSSGVDWKIYFRYQSLEPEDQRLDDPLSQQRELLRRPKRSKRLLQSFSSNELMTFVSREFRSGVFILEVLARERHTTVQLYATASPDSEMPYPEVPSSSSRVDVVQSDNDEVTVAWKASPSEVTWSTFVEYCVGYNTRRNYRTLCALNADRQGETPPPVPNNSGFGFHWEKTHARHVARMRKTALHTSGGGTNTFRDVHLECVGRRTWYTMSRLLPGTQYFVDVFAISPSTNRSAAYKGTSFVTEGPSDPVTLHERKVMYMSLRHKQGASAIFEYSANNAKSNELVFDVLPCYGRMNVEIVKGSNQQPVASRVVRHLHKFHVHNATSDLYTIRVTGDGKQTQSLKILATRRPKKDPFPEMGDDTRLHAIEGLASCTSVTLAWSAPDEKAMYCLYKRKEGHSVKRLFTKQDLCNPSDVAKRSEKVFCRRYRKAHKLRSEGSVRETVGGLRPGVIYLFELQLTRRRGETLTYDATRAATRDKC